MIPADVVSEVRCGSNVGGSDQSILNTPPVDLAPDPTTDLSFFACSSDDPLTETSKDFFSSLVATSSLMVVSSPPPQAIHIASNKSPSIRNGLFFI